MKEVVSPQDLTDSDVPLDKLRKRKTPVGEENNKDTAEPKTVDEVVKQLRHYALLISLITVHLFHYLGKRA